MVLKKLHQDWINFSKKKIIYSRKTEEKENEDEGNGNVQEGSFELEDNNIDDPYINGLLRKL